MTSINVQKNAVIGQINETIEESEPAEEGDINNEWKRMQTLSTWVRQNEELRPAEENKTNN